MITAEKCRELFEYRDGALWWREHHNNRINMSKPAGYTDRNGYRYIGIDNKKQAAHRIIFLMTNGWLPPKVDHIDYDPRNNKPSNLRACTQSQNMCNRGATKANTTGYVGVTFDRGKYKAQIKRNYKNNYLGRFDTAEQAHAAYCEASERLHGEFARTE